MKKTNGLSALIKLTIAVVALSGLISAFLLRRSPDYSGSGKVLMRHGKLTTLDAAEIAAKARECARATWSRIH